MFKIGDYIMDEEGKVGQVVKTNIYSVGEIDYNLINTTEDICIKMIQNPSKTNLPCWVKQESNLCIDCLHYVYRKENKTIGVPIEGK